MSWIRGFFERTFFGGKVIESQQITDDLKLLFTDEKVFLKVRSGDTTYLTMSRSEARHLAREIAKRLGPGPGWHLEDEGPSR